MARHRLTTPHRPYRVYLRRASSRLRRNVEAIGHQGARRRNGLESGCFSFSSMIEHDFQQHTSSRPAGRSAGRRLRQLRNFERQLLRELERLQAPDEIALAARELLAAWRARST
jgi:hypothetical protein